MAIKHVGPFALVCVIDPETLHESFEDPAAASAELDRRLGVPVPEDPETARDLLVDTGTVARVLGKLDVAEDLLRSALNLAPERTGAISTRARLAHVLQRQQRFDEATAELDSCLREAQTEPGLADQLHHQAGECAYDLGDWDGAVRHFRIAQQMRELNGDPQLAATTEVAIDAADACRTAAAVDAELRRIVPAMGERLRPRGIQFLAAQGMPHPDVIVELRTLLLAGPVSEQVVEALYYLKPAGSETLSEALADLVRDRWLIQQRGAYQATDHTRALIEGIVELADVIVRQDWGHPESLLQLADQVLAGNTDLDTPLCRAWLDAAPAGTPAGRLFDRCLSLHHHQGEARSAALRAMHLTREDLAQLPAQHPVRRDLRTLTGRIAGRLYRPLPQPLREAMVAQLRALPA
ncbi:tetratricopeptide repeat protein [Pseudonocardiaceae bacterium YIM PH 21723]|nr:tetratricopeptide repeat protein [Pseudonocardiaceae bacterium YIM PH 21723]